MFWRLLIAKPFPVRALTRKGQDIILRTRAEVVLFSACGRRRCPVADVSVSEDGLVTFRFQSGGSTSPVVLAGLLTNGDPGVFIRDEYRFLPVQDRIVVDVGASIGDTAVYFMARGARKVYGYEPFLPTYQTAIENVARNNMTDQVHLVRAAIGDIPRTICLREPGPDAFSRTIESKDGVKTRVVTLADVVRENDLDDVVLKMDCEGAEYEAILGATNETLRVFSHIQLEFHFGYLQLETKLKSAGFIVKHSEPERYARTSFSPVMYVGFIYAVRA